MLQLIAKDLLAHDLRQAKDSAFDLLQKYSFLPAPVETRWNSIYRLFAAIERNRGSLIVDESDLKKVREVEKAIPILQPLAIATDLGQSSSATLLTQLTAIEIVLPLSESGQISTERKKMLCTPPIVLLALLFPNATRTTVTHSVSRSLLQQAGVTLGILRSISDFHHSEETIGDNLDKEWNNFIVSPPKCASGAIDAEQFQKWWAENAKRFPRRAASYRYVTDNVTHYGVTGM